MPEGDAEEPVLADRRVADPLGPVLLGEPDVGLEDAAVRADVLAHEQDGGVGRHRVVERGVDRLAIGQLGRGRGLAPAGAASVSVDIRASLLEGRVRGGRGALGGGVDLGLGLGRGSRPGRRAPMSAVRGEPGRRGARSGRAPSSARARRPGRYLAGSDAASGRDSGRSSSRAGSARRRRGRARRASTVAAWTASTSWPSTMMPGHAVRVGPAGQVVERRSSSAAGCTRRTGCS